MAQTVEWPELRADFEAVTDRFTTLVAPLDPAQPVRGTEWTVGETVAHVSTAVDRWIAMAGGAAYDVERGRAFAPRMAEINRREVEAAGDRSGGTVVMAARRWLEVATDPDRQMQIYGLAETQCTMAEATGVLTGELLVHGYDVARSARTDWPLPERTAISVMEGALSILPLLYDGSATGGRTFTIDLRLRGRPRGLTLDCSPQALTISDGSPPSAAVHVSANPTAFVLVGYGRRSRWRAALTGEMVAWGRRPWLAMRMTELLPAP